MLVDGVVVYNAECLAWACRSVSARPTPDGLWAVLPRVSPGVSVPDQYEVQAWSLLESNMVLSSAVWSRYASHAGMQYACRYNVTPSAQPMLGITSALIGRQPDGNFGSSVGSVAPHTMVVQILVCTVWRGYQRIMHTYTAHARAVCGIA